MGILDLLELIFGILTSVGSVGSIVIGIKKNIEEAKKEEQKKEES